MLLTISFIRIIHSFSWNSLYFGWPLFIILFILLSRRGSWFSWSVKQGWRVVSMSTQKLSLCSSSESVGMEFSPVTFCSNKIQFEGNYYLHVVFMILSINAMHPQTKKILQLLRLRQVHTSNFFLKMLFFLFLFFLPPNSLELQTCMFIAVCYAIC